MSDAPTVILVCDDLMMASTVSGAAESAGLTFRSITCASELGSVAPEDLLILDLATPGMDPAVVAAKLPQLSRDSAIAYGPHVQSAFFEAARSAGFVRLLSRGRFNSEVSRLVSGHALQHGSGKHV